MHISKKSILLFLMIMIFIASLFVGYQGLYEQDLWSIGIYHSQDPFNFTPHPRISIHPVLTKSDINDIPARFVADPFMVYEDENWYMFFEVMNDVSGQADIGLAKSPNGLNWEYNGIVLDEPFRLSFPYVFKYKRKYYMIPESRHANGVRLYKASNFPNQWIFVKELISGDYADPSIVFFNGKIWMFVLEGQDTLALFYADMLEGPWREHPESPLVKGDRNICRPGGRLIVFENSIIRYTQDDEPIYGNAVRAFQIDEISPTCYKEHEISISPILKGSGFGWNAIGMHHIDPHQLSEGEWIACVDGKKRVKKFNIIFGAKKILVKTRDWIKSFF